MKYSYEDEFLVKDENLEELENEALNEVINKLNITDEYFVEKLTKAKVYMNIAKLRLESDGMKEKFDAYKNEFDYYYKLATKKSDVFNIAVLRG